MKGAQLWLRVKPYKKWKRRRQLKEARQKAEAAAAGGEFMFDESEEPMFKGKLTYAGVAGLALAFVLDRVGLPATPEEIEGFVTAVAAAVSTGAAIYGRYRASKKAASE